MMICAELPSGIAGFDSPAALGEAARLMEQVGFAAGIVTDHPVPSGKWMDGFGHIAHDPFVVLSLVAAATTKLKLLTGIIVLPYRNPFLTTRAISTLDYFSGGRVIMGVSAGYLRSEFNALGVDFDARNEIMDEYLVAMKTAWASEEFSFTGSGYRASGCRIVPHPVQKPHPPIWCGGNSPRAIRRAAEHGDAWYPVFTLGEFAVGGKLSLTEDSELADRIKYMQDHCAKIGRETIPDVQIVETPGGRGEWNPNMMVERIGRMRDLGIAGVSVGIEAKTKSEWWKMVERHAEVFEQLPEARATA